MQKIKDYRELLIIFDEMMGELKQAIRLKIEELERNPEPNNEIAKAFHTNKIIRRWFANGGRLK